ncbi:MAG TPA: ABC transporter substrate-binding protein, partial [Candidatus Acetothermia bacterium]|nr:ABC transporter substrate-binding protein [Candidatus Acetothermia bacterium]
MKRLFLIGLVLALALSLTAGAAMADKVKITWWHAMSGSRLDVVKSIVESFNATHPNIELTAMFTGSYAETLTKFIAAYRT